jgi:ribosomal protein L11 methyltransferase
MQHYTEVTFRVVPFDEEIVEILVAFLGEEGFDSFLPTDEGIKAYIPEGLFSADAVERVTRSSVFSGKHAITWERAGIPPRDWNKLWEESFTPVTVAGRVHVRATFHEPAPDIEHDIVIDPKMSFGTGHHPTTLLVIEAILELQPTMRGKAVLDMGCGTGILAILCARAGAARVTGIDIDEWAYHNARENIAANGVRGVEILVGDARLLEGSDERYDLVLANINRNILLEDMPRYAAVLREGGTLVLSGFYPEDLPLLEARAGEFALVRRETRLRDGWCAAIFNSGSGMC